MLLRNVYVDANSKGAPNRKSLFRIFFQSKAIIHLCATFNTSALHVMSSYVLKIYLVNFSRIMRSEAIEHSEQI